MINTYQQVPAMCMLIYNIPSSVNH